MGVLAMGLVVSSTSNAQAADELAELSLEQLLAVEVTSVSKRPQHQFDAPAAIYVITDEDIRRSTATTLPDLLRTVPGLHVAQQDRNKWSVSSRGFGGQFANKLLLLIDGRSVYNSNFAGVNWEARDVLMEDIARVEIIRGPAATLWGANGLNGVINVITKPAAETQGGLLKLGGGKEERAIGGLRYGGKLSDDGHYRVYFKARERASGHFADGGEGNDDWEFFQGGFRMDADVSPSDTLTLQGDAFYGHFGQTSNVPRYVPPFPRVREDEPTGKGVNLLGRWTHRYADDSDLQLRLYVDRLESRGEFSVDQNLDNYDIELQRRFRAGDKHDVLWSFGFHYAHDALNNMRLQQSIPQSRSTTVFSALIQDRIHLLDDRLEVTLGAKVEYNDLSGFEVQPGVRAAWQFDDRQTVWGAVSRGVRTPSTTEHDLQFTSLIFPGPTALILEGDHGFNSEELWAFEAGYRAALSESVSVDIAAFYNMYDDLRSVELARAGIRLRPLPHWVVAFQPRNNASAHTFGGEAVLTWVPKPWWRVQATYSYIEIDVDLRNRTPDFFTASTEGDVPEQQFGLRSSWDLSKTVELDAYLRYVDALPTLDVGDYWNLDVRLGWSPNENLEFALVGHGLLQPGRIEYEPTFVNTIPTEVERGVYATMTLRF